MVVCSKNTAMHLLGDCTLTWLTAILSEGNHCQQLSAVDMLVRRKESTLLFVCCCFFLPFCRGFTCFISLLSVTYLIQAFFLVTSLTSDNSHERQLFCIVNCVQCTSSLLIIALNPV